MQRLPADFVKMVYNNAKYRKKWNRNSEGLIELAEMTPSNVESAIHPYSRKVLLSDGIYEVMMATWTPGLECAPHDHGMSTGQVVILEGDFVETHFNIKKGELVEEKQIAATTGDVLDVHFGEFHSMVCKSKKGKTLHIYSPPITKMKVIDTEKKQILTVTDDCGAWVPGADQIVDTKGL